MKKELIERNDVCSYIIDYENGISCSYVTTNNKLTSYDFYNSKFKRLTVINDDVLEKLKNNHWSKHRELIENSITSDLQLEQFSDFDKLYYVGSSIDGMLFKCDGTPISTPFYLDDCFFQNEGIETTREKCQIILDSFKKEWIVESKIYNIPYYNQSGNDDEGDEDDEDSYDGHSTLSLLIKLPDDVYSEILGDSTHWYFDENKKAYNKLKN